MDADAQPKAVEQRHGRQHAVAGAEHGIDGNDLLGQRVEIPVRQQNSLGRAGRAAGIQNGGRIVARALDLVFPEAVPSQADEVVPHNDGRILGYLLYLPPLREHVARADGLGQRVADARDDNVDNAGIFADGLKFVVKLVERDHRGRLGLVDVKLKLLLARQRVHHVGHRADKVDRIEHINGLRAVRHGDRDPVVLAHADRAQTAGALFDLLHHLPVGGRLAHEVKCNVFRVQPAHLLQPFKHRAVKVIQRERHLAQMLLPRSLAGNGHQYSTSSFSGLSSSSGFSIRRRSRRMLLE